jgi:hypothetical protein
MTITAYRPPQQTGRESFAQSLHAEWTKFRTLRGWVIAVVIAAVLIDVVAVLVPRGDTQCGSGSGAACLAHVPTGPGGEASTTAITSHPSRWPATGASPSG